jgi:hypothetical protein
MALIGPGQIVSLRSATILQQDPAGANVARIFFLLNAAIDVPQRVRYDVVSERTYTTRVQPTRNPVQFGADITDHARAVPPVIRLTGTISDTPLGAVAAVVAAVRPWRKRSIAEFRKLEEMRDKRELVTVATSLKFLSDMLITEVTERHTPQSGRALEISMILEKQRIVGPAIDLPVPDLDQILNDSGSTDAVEGGTQAAEVFA